MLGGSSVPIRQKKMAMTRSKSGHGLDLFLEALGRLVKFQLPPFQPQIDTLCVTLTEPMHHVICRLAFGSHVTRRRKEHAEDGRTCCRKVRSLLISGFFHRLSPQRPRGQSLLTI